MVYEARSIDRGSEARARRIGRVLLALGAPLAALGGLAFAVVLNLVPLAALVPSRVQVTGPVVADGRAIFWVGMLPVLGCVATAQGAYQLARGRSNPKLLLSLLVAGVTLLGAVARSRL